MTRRDRCHLVGKRMSTLDGDQAVRAWIRVEVEELLGICCGAGPVTPEAYAKAKHLAEKLSK